MSSDLVGHALPVLDIAGFIHDPTSAAGARFVEELRQICHDVGFFYVAGHGVPDEMNDAIQCQARQFFALPLDERLSIENLNSPQFRGYTRLGGEYTAGHATLVPVDLPPALAAAAPGGASIDPSNPILANFGDNTLKVRMRSHPDVAQRHHADLLHGQ